MFTEERRHSDLIERLISQEVMEVLLEGPGVVTRLQYNPEVKLGLGSVLVIPFLGSKVVMIFNNSRSGWEFPGGKIKGKEAPLACAERELAEETGLLAGDMSYICTYAVEKLSTLYTGYICACKIPVFNPSLRSRETSGVGLFSICPSQPSMKDGFAQYIFGRIFKGKR